MAAQLLSAAWTPTPAFPGVRTLVRGNEEADMKESDIRQWAERAADAFTRLAVDQLSALTTKHMEAQGKADEAVEKARAEVATLERRVKDLRATAEQAQREAGTFQ